MLSLLGTVLAALLPASQPSNFTPSAAAFPDTTLEERLQSIVEQLEEERIANHIPGMALAIVKDDQVILTHGFGLADIETARPVDAETIFAIGSTTKAFTTALGGMLQDDGLLDFDDPVTEYLPYFQLPIKGPDAEGDATVTLRDLMSHRTGFTRMTALWAGGQASREEILHTAVKAEPWADFRKEFLYNNVMFLAAGMAESAAASKSWDELMQERIFTPLGMASTTLSVVAAKQDKRLALGYEWDASKAEFKHKPMRELAAVAPAGAINSNVLDMAQWLRFQLNLGEYDGQRLISEAALSETWSPNMPMGKDSAYGLGWMLHDDDGIHVVEHGGSIDGFGAEVAMVPAERVGFVLLTNVTSTPLQQTSIEIVFEGLMGDAAAEHAAEATDFDDYLGSFTADFGAFDGATFRVLVQNDRLAVDVPGQMVYELKSPDESGKWYFRLTNTIAVDFVRNEAGEVIGMNMFQGGLAFDLPREGFEPGPEIPLDQLSRFLGTYHDPALDEDLNVVIHRNRLAIDIPSQMVFDLRAPDEAGKRAFWVTDALAGRFNEDASGAITSLTIFERGSEREALRVGDAPEIVAPSSEMLAELLGKLLDAHPTRGLGKLLAEHGTLRATGTIRIAQAGLEGSFVLEARQDPPATRTMLDFGVFGKIEFGVLDGSAWVNQSGTGYAAQSGARLSQMLHSSPTALLGDWRSTFDSAHTLRLEDLDGQRALVVELQNGNYPKWTLFIDPTTGDLLRLESVITEGSIQLPMTTTFSDYKLVEGARVAHSFVESSTFTGRSIQTLTKVELGIELDPDFAIFEAAPK